MVNQDHLYSVIQSALDHAILLQIRQKHQIRYERQIHWNSQVHLNRQIRKNHQIHQNHIIADRPAVWKTFFIC